ncbi:MAG: hypothetical protein Q9M91_01945 [Candidatus Dojkabacteria bacterium]|nr:hypothetical protein [Candidatus Dojkabacteria bacterium]MDQ7020586.1 hypothetical protein [Candidatus Dojkabacteria bacterium]
MSKFGITPFNSGNDSSSDDSDEKISPERAQEMERLREDFTNKVLSLTDNYSLNSININITPENTQFLVTEISKGAISDKIITKSEYTQDEVFILCFTACRYAILLDPEDTKSMTARLNQFFGLDPNNNQIGSLMTTASIAINKIAERPIYIEITGPSDRRNRLVAVANRLRSRGIIGPSYCFEDLNSEKHSSA